MARLGGMSGRSALAMGSMALTMASGCCRQQDPWDPPSDWAVNAAVAAYLCAHGEAAASLCGVEAQGVANVETMLLVPERGDDNPGKLWVRGTALVRVEAGVKVRPAVPRHCGGVMTFSTKLVDGPDGSKVLAVASAKVLMGMSSDEGWKLIPKPSTGGGHGHHDLF